MDIGIDANSVSIIKNRNTCFRCIKIEILVLGVTIPRKKLHTKGFRKLLKFATSIEGAGGQATTHACE